MDYQTKGFAILLRGTITTLTDSQTILITDSMLLEWFVLQVNTSSLPNIFIGQWGSYSRSLSFYCIFQLINTHTHTHTHATHTQFTPVVSSRCSYSQSVSYEVFITSLSNQDQLTRMVTDSVCNDGICNTSLAITSIDLVGYNVSIRARNVFGYSSSSYYQSPLGKVIN